MITYCPSCRTHFRVHAEQLAARAGQVRCGKCSLVFDALEHLIEEIAPARTPRPKPEFEAMRADAADAEPGPELDTSDAFDIGAKAQERVFVQTADGVVEAQESKADTAGTAISESTIAEPVNAEHRASSGASMFGFGPGLIAEPVRPARRWPWLPGALLLLLILLAQATYHFRSAISLLFPETKPYAAALCEFLGCELTLPRRIALMSIEASDLQADTTNPNVMVLSATLKNRAIFDQQHPLLELTLTDAKDQPVVRRVLAPHDYLAKAVNTQTGFGANTEIAIKVFIEGSDVKATGYRLYLFYP
jgi:predicted Zn finger-like uncharacterized protein